MTLLVGVLCTNGIVIAADQQATHGTMGMQTIGQAITKVTVVGGTALFASSGHHGLGQQLEAIVQANHTNYLKTNYHAGIQLLQRDFRVIVDPALNTAAIAARLVGGVARDDATCGCLLAAPFKDDLKLIEITPQVAVECQIPEMPFVSLGSGKANADPFLGFLRRVFWPARTPTVAEGELAAYWTVKHAIDMKTQGVGFDVDVFTIEKSGSSYVARQLDAANLKEHEDFRMEAEKRLSSLRDELTAAAAPGATSPSEPPKL
jgi:20S proteasome alpha/beta subunit